MRESTRVFLDKLKYWIEEAQTEYNNTHLATGKISPEGEDDPENAGFDEGWLKALEFIKREIDGFDE